MWDRMLVSLSLALHCSPISLEVVPTPQLQAMALDITRRANKSK